jgi:hypothetical protein
LLAIRRPGWELIPIPTFGKSQLGGAFRAQIEGIDLVETSFGTRVRDLGAIGRPGGGKGNPLF